MTTNQSTPPPLTRKSLYDLVWSEPMLKVAARFDVSSSYMARVCTLLDVPRPERGYWAKLAVGKVMPKPSLPEAPPGTSSEILVNGHEIRLPKSLPRPPSKPFKRKPKPKHERPSQHALIDEAKKHFKSGRYTHEAGYLKPNKRLLLDLVVTELSLDKTLEFANELFLSLEERGHRVAIRLNQEELYRVEVDEREVQTKRPYYYYSNLWSPQRCTVVYIGTVAIGLTIIETSKEVEVRYVNGKYIPEEDYIPPKRGYDHSWTSTKEIPTGRLRLQAYSPYRVADWVDFWEESKKRDLLGQVKSIVRKLEKDAVEIARLVEEGQRRAEQRHQEWLIQQERRRIEDAERRAIEARKESREEILQIIEAWAKVNHMETFFRDAELRAVSLEPEVKTKLLDRIKLAREMIGSIDALDYFLKWKSPDER